MQFASLMKVIVSSVIGSLLMISTVQAQATRTWVSGVGDDANPCSRTAPCKTFAGAISKTASGGEISVLDPGGFGAVTITKPISIVAASDEGGVLAAAVTGIIINTPGASDHVHLQGLIIEGAGSGLNGVRILNGRNVTIEKCVIRGFQNAAAGNGISIESTANPPRLIVTDTLISKNVNGIKVKPAAGVASLVVINDARIVHNSGAGIQVDGATSSLRMNGSEVIANGTGLSTLNGGTIVSYGNNVIVGNASNGTPSSASPLQ